MKRLILLFSVFYLLLIPAFSRNDQRPYVAVFACPQINWEWKQYNPDLLFIPSTWKDFDNFLYLVKNKAGNKPIELDIDCHGDDSGLYLEYDNGDKEVCCRASLGYILNHIEKNLNTKNVTVFLDCCYSGRVYKETIRTNYRFATEAFDDEEIEDHPGIPKYPIWGLGSKYPTYGNLVWVFYHHNISTIEDLRIYETKPLDPKVEGEPVEVLRLKFLYILLYNLK